MDPHRQLEERWAKMEYEREKRKRLYQVKFKRWVRVNMPKMIAEVDDDGLVWLTVPIIFENEC